MPSTYSPDLRIELIANGEQSGTWGATTNNNLGTLIEDAISGLVSVSVTSADQAFTALDGVVDQARNAAIRLTTTTTAAFNVYAPPATKTYIIFNDSSYTATIYASTVIGNTTAAGTGVAVPAGKTMMVRCDGANFLTSIDAVPGSLTTATTLTVGTDLIANGDVALGNRLSGTYAQTATTVTVTTISPHGYSNGESVVFINVSGLAQSGTYTITYINTTSFSFTSAVSQATSGTCFVTDDSITLSGVVTAGVVIEGTNNSLPALRVTQTGTGNALVVDDAANPDTTPFIIDTNGNVITGYTQTLSTFSNSGLTPRMQQIGLTTADSATGIASFNSSTTTAPVIELAKSAGTTVGSYTALTAGTTLGTVVFTGSDGTGFSPAAAIQAFADGEFNTSSDTTDSPGRLVLSTTLDGTATLVERVRINNAGELILGSGEASGTTAGNTFRAPARIGTNAAGTNLTIQAGNGTGTGGSGYITLQTAGPGTTGATANTMVDRLKLSNGVMVSKAFDMDYGVVPAEQIFVLGANYVGSNVNTAQSLFGVGVTLAANTQYAFEMIFTLQKTAGSTSHNISLQFDIGSGSLNSIDYSVIGVFTTNAPSAITAPDTMQYIQTANATAVCSSTTSTGPNFRGVVRGVVSVNASGKWTPQYKLSSAPGGAYSTLAGSFVKIYPIGAAGADVNTGGWA